MDYPTFNYGIAVMPALNAGTTSVTLDSKENTTTSHPAFLEVTLAGGSGAAGLNWRGTWAAANAYRINDAVYFQGASYRAVTAIPANGAAPSPTNTTPWTLLAAQGATGATGATGAQGPKDDTGATSGSLL